MILNVFLFGLDQHRSSSHGGPRKTAQGKPANLELWHRNVQVTSKIKAKGTSKKHATKPAAIALVCSIYIFVELLKNLSSAPMNQIKIATILLFFEARKNSHTLRYEIPHHANNFFRGDHMANHNFLFLTPGHCCTAFSGCNLGEA